MNFSEVKYLATFQMAFVLSFMLGADSNCYVQPKGVMILVLNKPEPKENHQGDSLSSLLKGW